MTERVQMRLSQQDRHDVFRALLLGIAEYQRVAINTEHEELREDMLARVARLRSLMERFSS